MSNFDQKLFDDLRDHLKSIYEEKELLLDENKRLIEKLNKVLLFINNVKSLDSNSAGLKFTVMDLTEEANKLFKEIQKFMEKL